MSLIVSPDEDEKPSLSTAVASREALLERREELHALIRRFDDEAVWDQIQAKDVPAHMLDYVQEQLEAGFDYSHIRRQLGILRSTDKSWRKIMAALKQGFRVDGTAHLMTIAKEYRAMSQKMRVAINQAFVEGVETLDSEGNIVHIRGPSKELAGMIDSYNRLNQGFIKNAKDLGAYVEQEGKGGSSGVTIVVQSAVQLPSMKDVQAHQEQEREKNKRLLEQGMVVPEATESSLD